MNRVAEFERRVAAIFRTLGAEVEHDVSLAGNQIDILALERTPAGAEVRSAIEVKMYSSPVGVQVVNAFAGLVTLLRTRGLIDKAIIVASSGFTRQARLAAEVHDIQLLEFDDLEQRVRGRDADLRQAVAAVEQDEQAKLAAGPPQPKKAFVVMPFSPELNDVYILGIREVAESLGVVVERADEIQHNQSIPDVIRDKIRECDVVIADTSKPNPNVFYEVGMAHAIQRETILICRDAGSIPFDIASINHVVYTSIVELRDKLRDRLRATLRL